VVVLVLVLVVVVVVVVLLKVPKPTVEPRVEKLIGDYLFGGDHTFRRPNPRLPRFAQWPEGGRDAREIWIWLKVMMVLNWICGSTIGFFCFLLWVDQGLAHQHPSVYRSLLVCHILSGLSPAGFATSVLPHCSSIG
jgi:hypothetical protein